MAKKSMKERVASLLARAEDAASSETEVELCVQKAMDLMKKYGFTMDDVTGDTAEEVGQTTTPFTKGRPGGAMRYVQGAIATFTNTRVSFRGTVTTGISATYYGYAAERELAAWLHAHIVNAIKIQSALYDPGPYSAAVRARDRRSFAIYMAYRISQRLKALTDSLEEERGTGTDVMVIKTQKVDAFYEGLDLSRAVNRKIRLYSEGAAAGTKAGDTVSLHRPVTEKEEEERLLIGKGG